MSRISFDTAAHGTPGGDNFGEGNLDVSMITSFGLNVHTVVSNTNTSSSTEEGSGFGLALLDFVTDLAARPTVPQVLSISLGSLSAFSCDLLCREVVKDDPSIAAATCKEFMQNQRQVCMYLSEAQNVRINDAFKLLGVRGVSVFGSSGDGGSHWSFGSFPSLSKVGRALNKVGCEFQFPVFPTTSPYVTSVGGTQWADSSGAKPMAWNGGQGGGGFSWTFGAPAHQADGVKAYLATEGLPAASSFNASGRAYPDISCVSMDGTSQSSPSMAGIFSMVTDMRLNAGLKPLGFLGPRLWMTAAAHPNAAFESVNHEGDNTKTSCATGFPPAAKWDAVTGWGRPVWAGLTALFGSDAWLEAQ
jgi:tripeptidyl-peptidase-1|tara:strand:+ start:662 stop:1741 length:1080 start_codon:yes stop_codon:yes gene_type:complete